MIKSHKDVVLIAVLIMAAVLFVFSLFKNISYPLIWNDESETAMFATRVLEYGYPKVHDGKNMISLAETGAEVSDKRTDAYIGSGACWGHFYFGAIGAYFARMVDDIYLKTALLRIPFALIGFLGLIVISLCAADLFKKDRTKKLLFFALFAFFELLSVSLVLHLREVRYYSLLIFLSASISYLYISYRFIKKISFILYTIAVAILLGMIFNTYTPAYFIFIAAIGLHELLWFLKTGRIKDCFVNIAPLSASFLIIVPSLLYFRTFAIAADAVKFFKPTSATPWNHAILFLKYFQRYEFLSVALVVKALLIGIWLYGRRFKLPKLGDMAIKKLQISNYFTLLFICYFIIIIRIPLPVIFQRYFIVLQPVLAMILLLDSFFFFDLAGRINSYGKKIPQVIIFGFVCIVFLFNGLPKIELIKNHVYELFHQYKGPLDYAIPFIRSTYDHPERLVIATNYEECSYMYYLGSKVTIGYVGCNLAEDIMIQPDIIIIRRKRTRVDRQVFLSILKKGHYKKISFPILDYTVNNIPELPGGVYAVHLYKTPVTQNGERCLNIYVRQEDSRVM